MYRQQSQIGLTAEPYTLLSFDTTIADWRYPFVIWSDGENWDGIIIRCLARPSQMPNGMVSWSQPKNGSSMAYAG